MVLLLRHRPTKESATDRLNLNHRVTPRLHSETRIVAREAHWMTEERMALGSRPFYGFALPCFDLTKCFSRQLRLALPRMCFRTGRDNLRGVADGLEEILKR